jgi:hypothetical protein
MSFQTKFTFMWTRTSRRSPPLYAKTLMKNMRRERVSLTPLQGQTGLLYPQLPPLVFKIAIVVYGTPPHEHEKPPLGWSAGTLRSKFQARPEGVVP